MTGKSNLAEVDREAQVVEPNRDQAENAPNLTQKKFSREPLRGT